MQATLLNGALIPVLETAARVAAPQGSILECVLVSAHDCLHLTTTDRAIFIEYQLSAQVEIEGAVAVPAATLLKVVKSFPADETLHLSVLDDSCLQVCCGQRKATIEGMDAALFPALPAVSDGFRVQLGAETLAAAIYQVVGAAAPSSVSKWPALQGVLLQVEGDSLTLVAADSCQMAVRKTPLDDPVSSRAAVIVPAQAMTIVADVCQSKWGTVTISTDHNHIVFQLKGVTLVSRLTPGDYPDYAQVIPPDDGTVQVYVAAAALAEAVRTACIFAENDPGRSVNLIARPAIPGGETAGLIVSGRAHTGSAETYVAAQVEFAEVKPLSVNLAYEFLEDAANAASGLVRLSLRGSGKFTLMAEDGDLLRLTMPLHVMAEE